MRTETRQFLNFGVFVANSGFVLFGFVLFLWKGTSRLQIQTPKRTKETICCATNQTWEIKANALLVVLSLKS